MSKQHVPPQRRYPRELRRRAVRMVGEVIAENGRRAPRRNHPSRDPARVGSEALRSWVKQAEIWRSASWPDRR